MQAAEIFGTLGAAISATDPTSWQHQMGIQTAEIARRNLSQMPPATAPMEELQPVPDINTQEYSYTPSQQSGVSRGLCVAVIAPSVSTSIEARSIRMRLGYAEVNLREAEAILVVVRSMLFDPLDYSYDSIKELQDDAEGQLNICGENFHVYLYEIDTDLSVTQLSHTSYKADG